MISQSLVRSILLMFFIVIGVCPRAWSVEEAIPFKQYNADVGKYHFVKSFILSLGYYARVADRLAKENSGVLDEKTDLEAIRRLIDDRTLDNTEIRIAKNYLIKYQDSRNGLIRKIVQDVTDIYNQLLKLSIQERELWQVLERYRTSGGPADLDEKAYGVDQVRLAQQKKETAKDLLRQAVLVTKVMLSAELCESEDCDQLALTDEQRRTLVDRLDSFARENLEWGMQPGQSTVQACVATIREVLEDRLYHSLPNEER